MRPGDGVLLAGEGASRGVDRGARTTAADPSRRRRVWPWVLLIVLVALLGVAAVAGMLALQFRSEVKTVRDALYAAKSGIAGLEGAIASGDEALIQATVDDITANVDVASETVSGPLWDAASDVPFVGQNVDAVQRVTRAVDLLVERALPPGLRFLSAAALDSVSIDASGMDLEPFRQVQASLPEIADAFADAQAIVAPIETSALVPEVGESIGEMITVIDQVTPALGMAEKYLPTLLDMAGANGTKTYLLIFQNNAEIRATGGNPAASMLIQVTDGKVANLQQANSHTFYHSGQAGQQFVDLPDETTGLYLPTLTTFSQDFTFTPDFPTTVQLFQALWHDYAGVTFDGVVSIDPVVLSHLLAVTGPMTLSNGEQLTSENAVKLLLSDSYERSPSGADTDVFFTDAAQLVSTHLESTSWDPLQMLAALQQSAAEQRIYASFTDPAAQALAVEYGLDGSLATDTSAQTQLGIYLNDSSVGKLEYHLSSAITASCDVAARTVTTTMTLHNGITDDIRSDYTLGLRNGSFGIPRTTMMLDVLFFAPPGAGILHTTPAVGEVGSWERSGVEKGNSAVSKTVFVPKGETVTVSYTVKLPEGPLGPLRLRHTPTVTVTPVTIDPGCGALLPLSETTEFPALPAG